MWASDNQNLLSFTAPSGYYAVSCSFCGSPMPKTKWDKVYLVPAGTLDDQPDIKSAMHVFCESKASWDEISDALPRYPGNPPDA